MLRKFFIVLTICTAVSAPVHVHAGGQWRKTLIETHLYALQQQVVHLESFHSPGGAIEPFRDALLVVDPEGSLAKVSRLGRVTYLGGSGVPMNRALLEKHEIMKNPRFDFSKLRIADILLKEERSQLRVYVSHHYFTGTCIEFRISVTTLRLEGDTLGPPTSWETVFRANPCVKIKEHSWPFAGHHIGGQMLLDGEDNILVAIGDHELDGTYEGGQKISLEPRSHLGKLLRIELKTGNAEILALGLRVPQGLARDAKGNIWETEHGPEGGDELNLLMPGFNYGWPESTLGRQYGHRIWPHVQVQGRHSRFTRPVHAWIPSIATSAVIVSDSQQFPLWKDDLLIASLKARSIFRVRLFETRVIYVERIKIGAVIRDIVQMQDGSIALLLHNSGILFLTRSLEFCKDDFPKDHIYATDCDLPHNDYYQSIVSEVEPASIIRSRWNVYGYEDRLIYMKESCSQEDIDRPFFLHIFPVEEAVLADHSKQSGFDNQDFNFRNGDLWDGKRCIMVRRLPDYDISRIRTGQNINRVTRWWIGESVFDRKDSTGTDWVPNSPKRSSELSQAKYSGSGTALFQKRCSSCHNLYEEHGVGPHLVGIIGRQAGHVDGYSGSVALMSKNFVWTPKNLLNYLVNPARFAPGTSMADVETPETEARIIVDFLSSVNHQESVEVEHRQPGRQQVE